MEGVLEQLAAVVVMGAGQMVEVPSSAVVVHHRCLSYSLLPATSDSPQEQLI